jgi:hypothetical protein
MLSILIIPLIALYHNAKCFRFMLLTYWTYLLYTNVIVALFADAIHAMLSSGNYPVSLGLLLIFGRFVNTVMLKCVGIAMGGLWTWKLCCVILYYKIHNLRACKHLWTIHISSEQCWSCQCLASVCHTVHPLALRSNCYQRCTRDAVHLIW